MTRYERAAGILLHITSLPSDYGIGDLGEGAYRFVDFLAQAGQRIWQILPLGPTTRGDSPYSCYSAFAGNMLLISPTRLVALGLLQEADLPAARVANAEQAVDYAAARRGKSHLLRLAFDRFLQHSACEAFDEFEAFCTLQKWWLDDFALFSALMQHFETDDWCRWEPGLVGRQSGALSEWRERLASEIEYAQFVQYVFHCQWRDLQRYAAQRRVKLFGDMPIFVAHGSADVWSHQELFWLEPNGAPRFVAGVPPDYFSKTGQLWGNPLYRWEALAAENYRWWTRRFQHAFELYDLLRIDHFRGFEAYWEVSAKAKTAIAGRWVPGPGEAPFRAAERHLGALPIIAEDLGMITEAVHQLRDALGFPGMRVLQFGFDHADDTFHRPESYPAQCAAYTGTHDNNTLLGWYQARPQAAGADILQNYLQDPAQCGLPIHWQLISMVLRSQADLAMVPLQDILGLDDTARMNIPGKAAGNWRWRFQAEDLSEEISDRLRLLSVASDR